MSCAQNAVLSAVGQDVIDPGHSVNEENRWVALDVFSDSFEYLSVCLKSEQKPLSLHHVLLRPRIQSELWFRTCSDWR